MKVNKRIARIWGRSLLAAAMLTIAVSGNAYADETNRLVPGTKIAGVLVGGKTTEEAKAEIEQYYSGQYELTVKRRGGTTETIKGTDIGYHGTVTGGIQAALDQQNASGRLTGPAAENNYTISVIGAFDEGALAAKVQALSCISGSDIVVTKNAQVSSWEEGKAFTIVPEVSGNSISTEKAMEAIKAALASGASELDLDSAGCYDAVTVTSADAGLKELCDVMNRCKDMTITYVFGDRTKDLSGAEITSWFNGVKDGAIDVNYSHVAAYVAGLAAEFDTVGRTRTFTAADGRNIDLTGPYGWQMDQAGEAAALIAMIQTGQTQNREPLYSLTAADRNNDWGNTYVEIDLTNQKVYMRKDGEYVWGADCVTGNVSKNYTTPPGIYSLTYKQRDRVLRGKIMENGKPEYESPVKYWMPFNGGIGLHDANWRGKFGGAIYKTGGSHGCVNLPPATVPALYDMVYKGIPVICYN